MKYKNINLETLSEKVLENSDLTINEIIHHILIPDIKNVGTKKYIGFAYFWGYHYKHTLRDVSIQQRKKIHNLGLDKGIDFINPNKEAWYCISKVLKCDVNTLVNIKGVA
tara:strand:+ start:218 stop:547 length:330 start_codon:yes stop_codon:yes gene_type:complete